MAYASKEYGVQRRLATLARLMDLKGTIVLDTGCGTGRYLGVVAKLGAQYVVGIDIQRKWLKEAKSRFGTIRNIHFVQATAEKLPIKNRSVNLTLMIDVIEHVDSEHKTLSEAHRILKSKGKIFIGAPNKFYPFDLHGMTLLGVKIGNILRIPGIGIPILSWAPNSIRQYVKCTRVYSQKDLVYLLKDHDFIPVLIDYMMPPVDKIRCSKELKYAMRRVFRIIEKVFLLKYIGSSVMLVAIKR